MTYTDKRPLQQRSTQELERGLSQGIFSWRKISLVKQILLERPREESTGAKKSATHPETLEAVRCMGWEPRGRRNSNLGDAGISLALVLEPPPARMGP